MHTCLPFVVQILFVSIFGRFCLFINTASKFKVINSRVNNEVECF